MIYYKAEYLKLNVVDFSITEVLKFRIIAVFFASATLLDQIKK